VVALVITHVGFLVPEFQEFGPAVVLKGAQVGVKVDVWFHKADQHSPSLNNVFRVDKDSTNYRLKYVSENLEIVFVQLI
jgi:hypothetical protein